MLWTASKNFTPPVDVIERSDQIIVLVEIAGMKAENLSISLVNRHLIISGNRRRPHLEGTAYHRVEIGFGEFKLDIPLPWTVQSDEVSAVYRDGFLKVNLPRRGEQSIRVVNLEQQVSSTEEDEAPND